MTRALVAQVTSPNSQMLANPIPPWISSVIVVGVQVGVVPGRNFGHRE